MKKQYNLPHNDNYTVVESYYTGGMENGTVCENCGKLISNVVTIKNSKDKAFNVGMDCAETLSNVNGLYSAQEDFKYAKKIRSRHNKKVKEGIVPEYEITYFGKLKINYSLYEYDDINLPFAFKFFNDYLQKISNPDKLNFKYNKYDIQLPFDKCRAVDLIDKTYTLEVGGYNVIFSVKQGTKTNGELNGSYLFVMRIGEHERSTYMYNDITNYVNALVNKINFDTKN